ncbi:MAG: LuxR C-terminal-related transcriptional regulator, partial [Flavobacteriaceae bacterium]|nr:LuxR C-terminal-related transcriptional regulator [Flavobacteriaceae bacterium]
MNKDDISKVMQVWESENKILKPTQKELYLEIIDQIASLFSVGKFYYYILNFENIKMELVHEGTREVLGIEPDQFTMRNALELMHPDDLAHLYEKELIAIDFLFNNIAVDDILLYKVVYLIRLKHLNGHFKTILHQAKALSVTEDGKIQYVLGIHTDVTYLNIPFNHNVSFISSKRPSYYAIKTGEFINFEEHTFKNQFTSREIEIIHQLSKGNNFNQIAKKLYVSPHTINTHKKNILSKSGCKNTPELI